MKWEGDIWILLWRKVVAGNSVWLNEANNTTSPKNRNTTRHEFETNWKKKALFIILHRGNYHGLGSSTPELHSGNKSSWTFHNKRICKKMNNFRRCLSFLLVWINMVLWAAPWALSGNQNRWTDTDIQQDKDFQEDETIRRCFSFLLVWFNRNHWQHPLSEFRKQKQMDRYQTPQGTNLQDKIRRCL